MPTFREDLHLGHNVPTTDTADIVNGAITEDKLADGAVTTPKIADRAVTEPKLADEAVSMRTLDNEVKTLLQQGADSSWTPKGNYSEVVTYQANDLVYYPETNSSYISLRADNTGHVPPTSEYSDGWWMKVIDGSYEKQAAEIISAAVEEVTTLAGQSVDAIQSLVDNLPVAQVKGDSTTSVMSQKAVTDEFGRVDDYIGGDVRTLAVGQVYALGEGVKTSDGQMKRMAKEVKTMNTTDAVVIGDLKAANNKTYKALYPISAYSSSGNYSTHIYAVGRPAGATIEVTIDSEVVAALTEAVDITVTIVGVECTVSVDAESTAVSIAADILTAFGTQSEWNLTDNEDGTLTLISKVAKSAAPTISSSVGESGVTVAFVADSAYAGATTTSKITDDVWGPASVADMYGDTGLYQEVNLTTLTSTYTSQNSVVEDLKRINDGIVYPSTDEAIPLSPTSEKYYTYSNESIGINSDTNYTIVAPIDVTRYKSIKLKFYLAAGISATTCFVNANGVMVGSKLTNTSGDYVEYAVPENAVSLYMTTRHKSQASYGAIGVVEGSNVKAKIADIESEILVPQTLDITSYAERKYVIAISTGKWTSSYQTDKKHILVPIGNFKKFRITGGGDNYSVYSFLTSNAAATSSGTPDYAVGYVGVKTVSKGRTIDIDIPLDAKYLYLSLRSIDNNGSAHYEPQALYGLLIASDAIVSNTERIEALEEEAASLPYEYTGGRILFDKKYHYNITSWLTANKTHQSGASFGNYYFMLNNLMANVYVWNLNKKTMIYTWTNAASLSSIHHCNQCNFSTRYYDENDPFPLLYVSVLEQTSGTYNGRCSIEAYRITTTYDSTTEEYTSFDFTLVQTIYLPTPTTDNGMNAACVAVDRDRNRLVIYSKNLINGYYLSMKITEFNIPALYSNGAIVDVVDLQDNSHIVCYDINTSGAAAQGGVIHNCKLYFGRGYANVNHIELDVVDLIEQRLIADISLYADGFRQEPEGVFVYNNTLLMSTNSNNFYAIYFE